MSRKRRLRLGILGSTRGTDMEAIVQAIEAGHLDAEIAVVCSDRRKAGILERARDHALPAVHAAAKEYPSREAYDRRIHELLKEHGVDLVLLIGYMRIVSPWLCSRWEGRIINVHPSLLPDFAGGMDADVHQAVIDAGRTETGCTVHQVTFEVDGGPVLLQRRCPVLPGDTTESLKARVQQLEGEALITVIADFAQAH